MTLPKDPQRAGSRCPASCWPQCVRPVNPRALVGWVGVPSLRPELPDIETCESWQFRQSGWVWASAVYIWLLHLPGLHEQNGAVNGTCSLPCLTSANIRHLEQHLAQTKDSVCVGLAADLMTVMMTSCCPGTLEETLPSATTTLCKTPQSSREPCL